MKFDFSNYPIAGRGYAERPMAFLDIVPGKILGGIVELALIETGNRAARERWQKTQLRNLLTHASQRSSFWRNRLGPRPADSRLDAVAILTRTELRRQVETEGSLLRPSDGLETSTHATSGSSGTPVEFHISQMNGRYNDVRYLAQEFMDGKDLSVNRTSVRTAKGDSAKKAANISRGFTVEKKPSWLGEIGSTFKSGELKKIEYLNPDLRDLVRELRKDAVGQLVTNPRMVAAMISHSGARLLRDLRVSEFVAFGEAVEPGLYQAIADQSIPIRSTYSCEEVGPIGSECEATPGHYHVATSNVIVETEGSYEIEGKKLGRLLLTHLHSYATPFIRYDLGDVALLAERCPCGHDGPTIHSLYGRLTNALKHRDGTLSAFLIRGEELLKIVEFTEFRIRQVSLDMIIVELGRREAVTPEEVDNVTAFLRARAGHKFRIEVVARSTIDWGESAKKLSFRCEI
jgi:phenylacetate-coenzyme A ligase PaaK-like adenylate-forming protein